MCFALGWPTGLDLLLEAGADPSPAIGDAVAYQDKYSVRTLLDRHCYILESRQEERCYPSVFETALFRSVSMQQLERDILVSLVQALARSRRALMKLAKQYVSKEMLKKFGWEDPSNENVLLDVAARAIFNHLKEIGVEVPNHLSPGCLASIYHARDMTAEVAEQLFHEGFRAFDEPDRLGVTPLYHTQYWRQDIFSPASWPKLLAFRVWLLDHGAEPLSTPDGYSILHILASEVCDSSSFQTWLRRSKSKIPILRSLLKLLVQKLAPLQSDVCDCFCSTNGCTHMHSLLVSVEKEAEKRSWCDQRLWKQKSAALGFWVSHLPSDVDHGLLRREVCRFEIFTRLGIRHTCCRRPYRHFRYAEEEAELRAEEKAELQTEDAWLKLQLDAIMLEYNSLEQQYDLDPQAFWNVWWGVLESIAPLEKWHPPEYGLENFKPWKETVVWPVFHEDELPWKLDWIRWQVALGMMKYYSVDLAQKFPSSGQGVRRRDLPITKVHQSHEAPW